MSCPPPVPSSPPDDESGEKTAVMQGDQETLKKELQKAKEQESCLIIIRGTPQGHRFFLTQEELIIGRDPAADITIHDQGVSRKHAKLTKEKGSVRLTDLNSSNGTFLNDKRLSEGDSIVLDKEDMIRVGSSILKFLPAGELEILFYGNLNSAAHHDPMTKIYNKGYLLEALEAEFKRAKALHQDFSLLFFDLDHFKRVNDTYGHDAGDYVLIELTALVRTGYLRPKDVFARYGGEEFVILLSRSNATKAADLAEKIRAAVETHPFIYEGKRLPVTTSLGVAEIRADIESAQTLLKNADKALYVAKNSGRNRVVIAT
ncbi:MAG TPA: GGDEF domain-containing protein [Bdellovibrionales bacterium]|nr:GGDEF domain-containing protein [Bdellovibrionales bacterium]HCM40059.1 GGDEF domain-containing protein [Bdellovibrionales bacterium]